MTMLLVTLPLMVLGVAVAVIPLVLAIAKESTSQNRTLHPLAAFGHERAERLADREHLAA
ncbi:MAG: hypothetical protein M0004_12430 [Actinomycetota bacterium]|nr:hypothetical protein [Actinomycetota bacterium]MDA8297370.1 hypothetical protein [Actinomycetota bacterium]